MKKVPKVVSLIQDGGKVRHISGGGYSPKPFCRLSEDFYYANPWFVSESKKVQELPLCKSCLRKFKVMQKALEEELIKVDPTDSAKHDKIREDILSRLEGMD